MRGSSLAIIGLILGSQAAAIQAPNTIRVPVAPPMITIVGEPEIKRVPKPDDEIYVSDPTGRLFNEATGPRNVRQAVEALRQALPSDYLQLLMEHYGYRKVGERLQTRRSDIRYVDLAHFLLDRWIYAQPNTRLAKEFDCLNAPEATIDAFIRLLVSAELDENPDVYKPASRELASANYSGGVSAGIALEACEKLVDIGWQPEFLKKYPERWSGSMWFSDETHGSYVKLIIEALALPEMKGRDLDCYQVLIADDSDATEYVKFVPYPFETEKLAQCPELTFVRPRGGRLQPKH